MAIYWLVEVLVYAIFALAAGAGLVVLLIGYRIGRRLAGHEGAVMVRVDVALGAAALVVAVALERIVPKLPSGQARLTFSYVLLAAIALVVLLIGAVIGRLRGRAAPRPDDAREGSRHGLR